MMRNLIGWRAVVVVIAVLAAASVADAQEIPADYKAVLDLVGKPGDFKDQVLKLNIPRNDLKVTVDGVSTPTPLGFGGWLALTKGGGGVDVMMGDLVLTEDEVNPVMSALLDNGLDVTALPNHFFWETPRIFYMHVHGMGKTQDLAQKVKPAVDLIGRGKTAAAATPAPPTPTSSPDGSKLAAIVGHQGEQSGAVYKITIGRPDLNLREHGASINARMGLNTWAAFAGSDDQAVVAGDVAMLAREVTPVLRALRKNGISIVALHHHMTGTEPTIFFLHYWGKGHADELARAVKAAVDLLGKPGAMSRPQ